MDEPFTASTESAAPADSGVDATTTAASSAGAGEQTAVEAPAVDATAPATADDQIDVGWTLEDEAEAQPTIPDDDSDIDGLLNDPGVDQEKAPGVVVALRNARQEARAARQEAQQLRQQLAALDGADRGMGIFNKLMSAAPETGGAIPFLQSLYDEAFPQFDQLVGDVVRTNPDDVIARLQEMGRLPAEISQPRASIDADALSQIPEHLRGVAQRLATEQPKVLEDLMLQDPSVRDFHLERERKIAELDERQQAAERQEWQEKVTTAKQQGQQAITDLSGQYEKAHYAQLAKWTPYGPENKDANTRLHREIVGGALDEIMDLPEFAKMAQDAQGFLREAPIKRLNNQTYEAENDERQARALAARFNTRLGQLIKARLTERDSVYADARKWREYQRQNAPNRTEIPGQSTQITNGNGPKALDGKGRITEEYKQGLADRLSGMFARR